MLIKIDFDKETCIGCGACTSVSKNWVLEGDKVKPRKTQISKNELNDNKEAEDLCPVDAIKIRGGGNG